MIVVDVAVIRQVLRQVLIFTAFSIIGALPVKYPFIGMMMIADYKVQL